MGARVKTVAFQGIEAVPVDVQAQFTTGVPPTVTIVGLPDKAIREAGERVRAALLSSGLSLPPRRIVVNLAPADLPKEGSHFDLPIALALLAAIGVLPSDSVSRYAVLGELVALSASYFGRAFKTTFGETPHAYITRRRLEAAKDLMLATRDPLSQIAYQCGFADQSHLCRLFRRSAGMAPQAWRRANRMAA